MRCPSCKTEVPDATDAQLPAHFPFCCERCRMVDLGHWFAEDYRIERQLGPEDDTTLPGEPDRD